jgi:hypothetical protein
VDWKAEHSRECKRTERGVAKGQPAGLISLPAIEVTLNRITTEVSKPQCIRLPVSAESRGLLKISRVCCRNKKDVFSPVPMGWILGEG